MIDIETCTREELFEFRPDLKAAFEEERDPCGEHRNVGAYHKAHIQTG